MRFYIFMKKFLTLITLIVITVHCTKKVDYQKTNQEIETNQNQFDLDFGIRGKTYMFYNNSSHYFYLKMIR